MKNSDIKRTGANGRRSSCTACNGFLYTSGITTVDIAADIKAQAQDIFTQLDKLMSYNGTDKHNILQAHVTLKSMGDFGAFNSVWDLWVDDGHEPALHIAEGNLALPQYLVAVSLVAAIPD